MSGIAAAFVAACEAERLALKPGNVHVWADGRRMTVTDFRASARAAAPAMAEPGLGVGERVWRSVAATHDAVGQNTNLGILLLAAPLAQAAQARSAWEDLRAALGRVLAGLDVQDARHVYRAIRLARPAGLGRAPRHDVQDEPEVTLLEAMRAAADRDSIARQYASGFADVLELGLPRLRERRAIGWPEPWAVAAVHLGFLGGLADSHLLRKYGPAVAEEVRTEAGRLDRRLLAAPAPDTMI
ncbi:MAG TPA: triphosphoribosyl-dephospho-CoA synthase, partial [Geminicoccaceae bacterium]|nr:triphosphoribosyl-dephospho-CoA synthase [Geminicoccaceae bacterium]